MARRTWLEAIVEAFEALGGEAHYSDLYKQIKKNPHRELTSAWQATLRREIENHSSDSENYIKGKPDLFYSRGIGTGIWGLRKNRVTKKPEESSLSRPYPERASTEELFKEASKANKDTEDIKHAVDIKKPEPTERIEITTTRIIRDTRIVKQLKQIHADRCQVCGKSIILRSRHYSEGHHLQPLGGEHQGPDIPGNIIIVCPNHHAEMDYGVIAVNPETLGVEHYNTKDEYHGQKLRIHKAHPLEKMYLEYHYYVVFKRMPVPSK